MLLEKQNSLKDKVAIVTGSSRGIGKAIAIRLAKLGAIVVLNYCKEEEKAKEVALEIESLGAYSALLIQADVSKSNQAQELVNKVISKYNRIDVLINNAGIQRSILAHKMRDNDWHEVMDVNLSSVFYVCRAVLPFMIAEKSGHILNIGSASGFTAHKGAASYVASKYGLIGLTKVLALEVAEKGIQVNGIAPGLTDTDMVKGLSESARAGLLNTIPMKRMAKTEEVASMVEFVLTQATYSTGNFFHVSGGFIMA